MSVGMVHCPSCRRQLQVSETCRVQVCDDCAAVLRTFRDEAGSWAAERLGIWETETALRDLYAERSRIRGGAAEDPRIWDRLFRALIVGLSPILLLLFCFYAFGKASEDTLLSALILGILLSIPLLLRQWHRARAKAKFGHVIEEMDLTISTISERLAAIRASTDQPPGSGG